MKKLLAVSALAMLPFSAIAADLPARLAPASPRAEKPLFTWTGVYGIASIGSGADRRATGLNFESYSYSAGDVFYNSNASGNYVGNANSIPNGQLAPPSGFQTLISHSYKLDTSWAYNLGTSNNSTGYQEATYPRAPDKALDGNKVFGLAALELGYRRQVGDLVFGLGADFSLLSRNRAESWASQGNYAGSSGFVDNAGAICGAPGGCSVFGVSSASGSVQVNTNWLSTLRGNVGYAQDRLLVFATGGLAMGRVEMRSSASWVDSNAKCLLGANPGGCGSDQSIAGIEGTTAEWSGGRSFNRLGYVVGGGVAYGLTDNVFVNLEAQYYNLGNASLAVAGQGAITCSGNNNNQICAGSSGASPQLVDVANYTVSKKIDGAILRAGLGVKF